MTEQVLDSDLYLNPGIHEPDSTHETPAFERRAWRAGDLIVDIELRRLYRAGERIVLQETPLRLLCLLLERGGRPVSRRELHRQLWPRFGWESFERNLNTAVRKLRRAIGDDAREPKLIETLRASGYRWIGPAPIGLAASPASEPAVGTQQLPNASSSVDAASAPRRGRWLAPALSVALAAVAFLLVQSRSPESKRPWVDVDVSAPAGSVERGSALALGEMLQGVASGGITDGTDTVHVALSVRAGEPYSAEVTGRGARTQVRLADTPLGRERLLAEVASRLPPGALRHSESFLPPAAERAFADAGAVLMGGSRLDQVQRAIGLLESVLSVAPAHSGALRLYARAQRIAAILGRNPAAAREKRLVSRAALGRAVIAEPGSAGVAADAASQLFWGEGNAALAADWFDLARREAPQDADVLHAFAWFALADNRIDDAMQAINSALAIAPLNVSLHSDLGWFYFRTGRYDDALRQCRIALEMSAANEPAQICEERALAESGRIDEAWKTLRRHAPEWLDEAASRRLDALEPGDAYRAAMHLAAAWMRERHGATFYTGCLEAIAGERDAAIADLAVAEAIGDPELHLARVTPELVRLLGPSEVSRLAGFESAAPVSNASG